MKTHFLKSLITIIGVAGFLSVAPAKPTDRIHSLSDTSKNDLHPVTRTKIALTKKSLKDSSGRMRSFVIDKNGNKIPSGTPGAVKVPVLKSTNPKVISGKKDSTK